MSKEVFFTIDEKTDKKSIHFRRLVSNKQKAILNKIFNEQTQVFLSDTQDINEELAKLHNKFQESIKISLFAEFKESRPSIQIKEFRNHKIKITENNTFDIFGIIEAITGCPQRITTMT